MTPTKTYQQRIDEGLLNDDSAQRATLVQLDRLYQDLVDTPKGSAWSRLFKATPASIKGLYMYGGVGRGKSMLMDLFFTCAPIKRKKRVHFHAFMQDIHNSMHIARKSGVEDALRPVADDVIKTARLLCFDEMQITDITDAMIVGRLFDMLFEAGVVIVATSNRHPDDLYQDGLNRALFLPFIERIKSAMVLHNLEGPTDFRQDRLKGSKTYFWPLNAETQHEIDTLWTNLTNGQASPLILKNKGRDITLPAFHNGIAMASFADLCTKAYGASDYLLIAQTIRLLILTDIPELSKDMPNEAKRFVTLIDALYEAGTALIISAETEPELLYQKGAGSFEFERTASRLREMQSADWART